MNRTTLFLFVIIFPATVFAGPTVYVSGSVSTFAPSDSELITTNPATQNILNTGGVSKIENAFETGYGGNLAIGVQVMKRLRVEGEYSYRTTDQEKTITVVRGSSIEVPNVGEVVSHALMVNSIFDFRNSTRFTPYLGTGIGINFVEFSTPAQTISVPVPGVGSVSAVTPGSTVDDSVFAYQLMAGVGYWIAREIVGFIEYRYQGAADLMFGTTEAEYGAHNFGAGVRIYFGEP